MSIDQVLSERRAPGPHWKRRVKKYIARQAEIPFANESFRLVGETQVQRVAPDRAASLFCEILIAVEKSGPSDSLLPL